MSESPFPKREVVEVWLSPHDIAIFKQWARRAVVVSGADLQKLHWDGSAGADKILIEAERRGWITRASWCPSQEQRFFGIGGSDAIKKAKAPKPYAYPCEYCWEVAIDAPVWD